jgi:putative oxidoreductase
MPATSRSEVGFTLVRVVLGIIFTAHGAQKFFGYGLAGVAQGFAQMGVPAPSVTSALVAGVEFLGGLALIVGLLARLAGLGTTVVMIGAISLVHLKNGFFNPTGIEFPLILLTCSVAVILRGAGPYSVDALLARRRRP